jgi:hypothetical protein
MAGADYAAVKDMLHEHVAKNVVDIFYQEGKDCNPLMAAMDAVADTGEGFGRKLIQPIVYGTGTSVGADFTKVLAKAQSATVGASGLYSRWEIDPVKQEAVARWDRDAMDAAMGKSSGETFKVMTKEMDLKIAAVRKQLATLAFGTGTGALGVITAVSSTGFTVAKGYANRFHRGMDVTAAATAAGAWINSGSSLLVSGTDPISGVITTSTDPTAASPTAWAVGQYVFNANDRATTGAALTTYANYVLPWGMAAWLPGTTVSDGTGFCGIIRDGQWELAGLVTDVSSQEPEEAFINTANVLFTTGGTKADMCICNPYDYGAFLAGKDKSKTVQIALGKYDMAFDGFNIHTLAGNIPVVPDAMCPSGEFIVGPFKDPEIAPRLVYLNDLVNIDNKDGLDFVRSSSGTAYEMRMYFRGNIVLPGPGKFARGTGLFTS